MDHDLGIASFLKGNPGVSNEEIPNNLLFSISLIWNIPVLGEMEIMIERFVS